MADNEGMVVGAALVVAGIAAVALSQSGVGNAPGPGGSGGIAARLVLPQASVQAGANIPVQIRNVVGQPDSIGVWAVGSDSIQVPQDGWHKWATGPGADFNSSIPTADYVGRRYVIVALELMKDDAVAATGNPYQNGAAAALRGAVQLMG